MLLAECRLYTAIPPGRRGIGAMLLAECRLCISIPPGRTGIRGNAAFRVYTVRCHSHMRSTGSDMFVVHAVSQ
jgi:hypothetical protein